MSSRRSALISLGLWGVAAAAAAAAFLPGFPPLPLLSVLPAVAVATAAVAGTGPAVLGAFAASIALVAAGGRLDEADVRQVPMLIAAAWAGIFLIDRLGRKHAAARREAEAARAAVEEEAKSIRKEISFYETRGAELSRRGELRRRLSTAAVELGAILEPSRIQEKLLSLAAALFPDAEVSISTPDRQGPASAAAFRRGQALVVPADASGGARMAAPIRSNRSIVAALEVAAGARDRAFTRDDLRLIDVLTGLASEALDNAALFDSVHQNALRDGLTGLLTHRAFQDKLESAVLEASRYHQPVSLIMADVDRFKSVNDTHGHPAGDAVLQGFAHVLDRNVRDVDIVSRYGGEEFVVLLFETPYDQAMATAERIRRDLAEQPFDIASGTLNVTASFGVATFPDDATSGQQLLRQADQRLYAAKRGGRDRVQGR